MECLITGASGFVGRWLRSALLAHGFDVRCFDKRAAGVAHEVVGDILDKAAVEKACEGVRVVFHLVGLQSSRSHSWNEFYALNVRGTEVMLEACQRHGVEHFVYFSTELVYGRQAIERVLEEAVPRPRGYYGMSKKLAEDACKGFQGTGLRVTVLRPCNITGPGKTRVVEELFRRVHNHAPIPMVGGAHRLWQAVDVRDVAEISARLIEEKLEGVFNIGVPEPPSVRDVYTKLIGHAKSRSRLVPVPAWVFRSACVVLDLMRLSPLTADQYHRLADSWIADPSRLLKRLRYVPRYDPVRSIVETYDAYVASSGLPVGQEQNLARRRCRRAPLTGQVVIVTGASRGIGRATALEFARSGARVVLAARSTRALALVRDEIQAQGGEAITVEADVRDQEQVRGLVRRTLAAWGRIDVLINNAGVTYHGRLVELPVDQLREMIEVNLVGTILCIQEVLPHFLANRRGHVVNVSSVLGKRGVPRQAVYAASKAAVLGLSEALRSELAPYRITVTSFCPSSTDTDMNRLVSVGDNPLKQFVRTRFMFTPEAVARRIVNAVRRRKREVVLSLPARVVVLANKLLPGSLDWLFARLGGSR